MSFPSRIGIAGVGLMGGSIALATKRAFPECQIVGFDPANKTTAYAVQQRIIDTAATSLRGLSSCEIIAVCVPLRFAHDTIENLLNETGDAMIVDIASVKSPVIPLVSHVNANRLVITHPMAGKERSGIEVADAELFTNRAWAICDFAGQKESAVRAVENWIQALGARVTHVPLSEHDYVIARTSHLPQLLSSVLAANLNSLTISIEQLYSLSGPGLNGMTRLAGSSFELWQDILEYNRAEITAAWQEFCSSCVGISNIEHEQIAQLFRQGNEFYTSFRNLASDA